MTPARESCRNRTLYKGLPMFYLALAEQALSLCNFWIYCRAEQTGVVAAAGIRRYHAIYSVGISKYSPRHFCVGRNPRGTA